MKSKKKYLVRFALIFFLILLVVAYFTNPEMSDLKKIAKKSMKEQISAPFNTPSQEWMESEGNEYVDRMVDQLVERDNYFICSVYTAHLPFGTYRFIGVFKQFIPLQKSNPFQIDVPKEENP
jgi:hypothetical protein